MLYLELSGKLLSRQIKKFLDNLSTITYNTWRVGVTLMQQSSDMRRFLSTAIELPLAGQGLIKLRIGSRFDKFTLSSAVIIDGRHLPL